MNDINLNDCSNRESPDEIIASRIIVEFRQHDLIDVAKEVEIQAQLAKGQLDQEDWQRLAEIADEA